MFSSFYMRSVFAVFYCAALCVINWLIAWYQTVREFKWHYASVVGWSETEW